MSSVYKIWFYIMNLYVISFKSVYGTLKMNLKWKRYKTLNLMSETRVFWQKEIEWTKVEDNIHCCPSRVFLLPKELEW